MTPRPHDALFKRVFEDLAHAAGLMRSLLPEPIVQAIDWSSLRREPGSYVDPKLADLHTDLLFSARLRETPALIYVLAEHQSTVDQTMPLRMLRYLVRVWEAFSREHPRQPLPVILPLVVAHAQGGWTAPRTMAEMFDPAVLQIPGIAEHVPSFALVVDDLAILSDDALRQRALDAFPRLALAMLRDSRESPRLLANVEAWRDTIREVLATNEGRARMRSLLIYIATISDLHIEQIRATIQQHVPEAEPLAMTTAKQLIQEGHEKGQAAVLLRLLQLKFGALDEASIQRVREADADTIDRIIRKVLEAQTLEAVFEG